MCVLNFLECQSRSWSSAKGEEFADSMVSPTAGKLYWPFLALTSPFDGHTNQLAQRRESTSDIGIGRVGPHTEPCATSANQGLCGVSAHALLYMHLGCRVRWRLIFPSWHAQPIISNGECVMTVVAPSCTPHPQLAQSFGARHPRTQLLVPHDSDATLSHALGFQLTVRAPDRGRAPLIRPPPPPPT